MRKSVRKIIPMLLMLCLLLWVTPSVMAAEQMPSFADVDEGDWFYNAVRFVLGRGLMQGTAENTFIPNMTTTRAMAVTVLWRLADEPNVGASVFGRPFSDVEPDAWYYDAVIWARENGIISGYSDGRFGPADDITREQLTTIVFNYLKFIGEGPEGAWMLYVDFEDADDISYWALEAVAFCYMKGIVTGNPNNTFSPAGDATRAEYAVMLMRLEYAIAVP